jgi:hypothetical protein
MDMIITMDGNLKILRGGFWKYVECRMSVPHAHRVECEGCPDYPQIICGDVCSLFGEPEDLPMDDSKILRLCHAKLVGSIIDQRPRPTEREDK